MKPFLRFFRFSHLSLKQRLPLLIFSLLLAVIICFSLISYIGVKNASLVVGRERLYTLTDQLSNMFSQSFNTLTTATHSAALTDPVKKYLLSGGTKSRSEALKELNKLQNDTLCVYAELVDTQKTSLLSTSNSLEINVNMDSVLPATASTPGYTAVGKMFLVGNTIYYPIVAAVPNNNATIGYIVRWRRLLATPKAIAQLGQLIGANGVLYFGNDDGKFWTDLIKQVPIPAINMHNIHNVVEYSRKQGDPLLASAQSVPNSRWLVLVEFSQKTILEASQLFLRWIIFIGLAFACAGSFITWLLSRNITRPLKKLTTAATDIAEGNYTAKVAIEGNDELGTLAKAFNSMVVQVRNAQQDLEQKVFDRTCDLEKANKEMEAFSYSVSHDLHAPLRIIKNYLSILSEKAADKLDGESTRIIGLISNKATLMSGLIDELLKLSYFERQELSVDMVDMEKMVRLEMEEQTTMRNAAVRINIKQLLPAQCDGILIRQVWSNLISNALKYSAKNEQPCIEIESFKEKETIVYSIKDNGVGFDMKYADKLFGVFQRMHGKKEFEGNGVGLALVQRVIQKHGGKVWAEAEENNGATFFFSLPAE